MLKIMVVVGTRPEIIRLSRVIAELDNFCSLSIVHTGQNFDYELNEVFFDELEIRKPDIFLDAAGETPAETIGKVIIKIDKALEETKPEAILLLGDTNSCLAAIAAKRRKIPIFHMEAGNRCFDFRVPEEINRRIVDHVSDIHLTYSEIARDYLIREGIPPGQVIKTGSPMREVLTYYREKIEESNVLEKLGLKAGNYYLVSAHREENVDAPSNLKRFISILNYLDGLDDLPVIVSTHPRTRKKLEQGSYSTGENISFLKPFGFLDYIHLQMHAKCVLSDSGTITEESSILNFPALNLRETHERPEGFEEAAVMFVGLCRKRVEQGLSILKAQGRGQERTINIVSDYKVDNVSKKVLRIIQSYTDYVNREVWKKYL